MKLEDKLRYLKQTTRKNTVDQELDRALDYLRRLEQPTPSRLPAQRMPKRIEEYVAGEPVRNSWGEFYLSQQTLPFGRPYGKLRIGDLSTADLSPLRMFLENADMPPPEKVVYLDTETTGLAGGTGTCAFLIGIGLNDGARFVVRQYFLRDFPEEKAALAALAEALEPYQGVVTYNGKTFDLPLLETRYALARLLSPFRKLKHLDLLHPARRLWKLRLESCKLTDLEREVLSITREGDVPGEEIPGIYFDYLRTGEARGLQPVFYHNALDILTLAALTVEVARLLSGATQEAAAPSVDLFSLSRLFAHVGATDRSISTCRQALETGLPATIEPHALKHLAAQYKRQRQPEMAVALWLEIAHREPTLAVEALEELAIYYEHRRRDPQTALEFSELAIKNLGGLSTALSWQARFSHRIARLRRKVTRGGKNQNLLQVQS